MEAQAQDAGCPRERRPFRWWWIPAYFIGYIVLDQLLRAGLNWLVATGGYGLSNAVIGLLGLVLGFVVIQRTHVRHRKLETDGDPEPLPAPYDYVTQAQPGLIMGWVVGVIAWAGTLAMVFFFGPASAVVLGPIIGTTAIIAGRMEMAHAKVMDARRGRPPAATPG